MIGAVIVALIALAAWFVIRLFPGFGNDPSDKELLPPPDYYYDAEADPWHSEEQ